MIALISRLWPRRKAKTEEIDKVTSLLTLEGIVCGLDADHNDKHAGPYYDLGYQYGSRLREMLLPRLTSIDISHMANQALRDLELKAT
jgi:hypothetical protein